MTTLPHTFKRIRLNLARSKEFPQGSDSRGYEFVAPLDATGHIDAEAWKTQKDHCRVRRFWDGQDDEIGRLVHRPGGPEHARWVFDYNSKRADDDESGYRFGTHTFKQGDYATVRNADGEAHTFLVASVQPAT